MQELEKILEEIEKKQVMWPSFDEEDSSTGIINVDVVKGIIYKYLSRENDQEITRSSQNSICGECSRRKWYQIGYEDGKKNNDGWIPVDERLPEEPKENPVFDGKELELYLVDIGANYPLRAFWNGQKFTDGWSILNVKAWQPLPKRYRPERKCETE